MEALAWVVGACFAIWATFRYPKKMALLVGGLVCIAIVFVAVVFGLRRIEENRAVERRASIIAIVTHNPSLCGAEFPLELFMQNKSDAELLKVTFEITGRAGGYSEDSYVSGTLVSDQIIPSGGSVSSCWRVPTVTSGSLATPLPENAVWSASVLWFTLATD